MLSTRLRLGNKPLRFTLGESLTPLFFLRVYLLLIAFYAVFAFFVIPVFGVSFLGLQGRSMKLGLYSFVLFTAGYWLINGRYQRLGVGRRYRLTALTALGLLLVEFLILLALGLLLGQLNVNWKVSVYQGTAIITVLAGSFTYYAIRNQRQAAELVRQMAIFMAILAIAEAISGLSAFLSLRIPFFAYDFFNVLPLAAIYFFASYATATEGVVRKGLVFLGSAFGCVVTFQKPIVVPFAVTLVFLGVFVVFLARLAPDMKARTVIKRLLLLTVIAVAGLVIIDIVLPGSFFSDYVSIFYNRFLKVSQSTGQAVGNIDGGRFDLWSQGWYLLQQRPLLGYGFGTGIQLVYTQGPVFPHNIFVDFMVGMGLVGLFGIVLLVVAVAAHLFLNMNWYEFTEAKLACCSATWFSFSSSAWSASTGANFQWST